MGLVDIVADALMESGCEVITSPAKGVAGFHGTDAVIVAGSLYANRWNRDARRFVRRNTAALRMLPVWLISSGPLDDSAKRHTIAPTKQVAKLAARIHAGCQECHRSKDGQNRAGDWRDEADVKRWGESVVAELIAPEPAQQPRP